MDYKDLKAVLVSHGISVNEFSSKVGPFNTGRKLTAPEDKRRGPYHTIRRFGNSTEQTAAILATLSELTGEKHRLAWIKSDLQGNTEIVKVIEPKKETD